MKIVVYTICKNEVKNIIPWLDNVANADEIFVLDTGSTDGSYELLTSELKQRGNLHIAKQEYVHFRFDEARNDNLSMVRTWVEENNINEDEVICWTIDLDERFHPNWYEFTKKAFEKYPKFRKLEYNYATTHDSEGRVSNYQVYDKCHRLRGARWILPIHEQMEYGEYESRYTDGMVMVEENEILVHHYQNLETNRSQYKELLLSRIKENRYDLEAMNHLCTEYFKEGKNLDALDTMAQMYVRSLQIDCKWRDCICGNIAGQLENIDYNECCSWYEKAISFNPHLRTYYLKYCYYLLYNNFMDPNPTKANKILEEMGNTDTVKQELWKELPGAFTYYPYEIEGLIRCWLGDYEGAKESFITALINLNDDEINYQLIAQRLRGYLDFAKQYL